MRALLLLVLAAAAAGAAWLLLGTPAPEDALIDDVADVDRGEPSDSPTGPVALGVADEPVIAVGRLPVAAGPLGEWRETPLPLAEGAGPVTGREILDLVAAARVVYLRFETAEDRATFERHVFTGMPRGPGAMHAMLEALFQQAGLKAVAEDRTLLITRAPPEEVPGER